MSAALVGRDTLLRGALAALDEGDRALTLRGPPGVGKSALARAMRASLRTRGRAVVSLRLEGPEDRDALLARLAAAVAWGAPGSDARATLDALARDLDGRCAVVFVDDVDASRKTLAALVDDLLDATERVAVVVCAWSRLDSPSERVIPVPPLAPIEAGALLDRALRRLGATTPLAPEHRDALIAHAAGLPLALELLAARAAALGGQRAVETHADAAMDDDALRRTLDAAWSLLDARGREALCALSTLRRRARQPVAEALIGGDAPHLTLRRLVEASLVQRDDDGGPHVALLDSVRDHAAQAALALGVEAALRDRHAEVLSRGDTPSLDAASSWRALDAARDDLLAAWTWSLPRDPPRAARLAVALDPVLVTQGPVSLHRRVLRETLDALPDDGAGDGLRLRTDLLLAWGRVATIRGHSRDAEEPWREALSLAERLGDQARVGRCAVYLSIGARGRGDLASLRTHLDRARHVAVDTRDHALLSLCAQAEGHAHRMTDDHDAAREAFTRGAVEASLARAPRLAGLSLTNLASLHADLGALGDARGVLAEARASFEACGDAFHRVRADVVEARVVLRQGDLDDAERRLRDTCDRALAFDDLDGALESLRSLVHVAQARGDDALAASRIAELEARLRFDGDPHWSDTLASLRASLSRARPSRGPSLRLTTDGRALRLDDTAHDLSRRGPLRRVLLALVRARVETPGRALSVSTVQAAGWPGERMFPESGAARVYMAVRRLRTLGLEPFLRTRDEGYLLDPTSDVGWDGPEALGDVR